MKQACSMLICSLSILVVIAGCPSHPKLPDDPGLLGEDLGLGITLGMPAANAADMAAKADDCEVVVVSREGLVQHTPYDSVVNPCDRVIVIHTESAVASDDTAVLMGDEITDEVRCYLSDPAHSVVQLGGSSAARLTEEQAVERYGQPTQRTETSDGEVHLTYYFSLDDQPMHMLELVLSFHHGGCCFALALSLQPHIR